MHQNQYPPNFWDIITWIYAFAMKCRNLQPNNIYLAIDRATKKRTNYNKKKTKLQKARQKLKRQNKENNKED